MEIVEKYFKFVIQFKLQQTYVYLLTLHYICMKFYAFFFFYYMKNYKNIF